MKKIKYLAYFLIILFVINILAYNIIYAMLPEVKTSVITSGDLQMIYNKSAEVNFSGEYVETADVDLKINKVYVKDNSKIKAGESVISVDLDSLKDELDNLCLYKSQIENDIAGYKGGYSDVDLNISKYEDEIFILEQNIKDYENKIKELQFKIENINNTKVEKVYVSDYDIIVLESNLRDAEKIMNENKELYDIGGISYEEYTNSLNNYEDIKNKLETLKKEYESNCIQSEADYNNTILKNELEIKTYESDIYELKNKIEISRNEILSAQRNKEALEKEDVNNTVNELELNKKSIDDKISYVQEIIDNNGNIISSESGVITHIDAIEGRITEQSSQLYRIIYNNGILEVKWEMDSYEANAQTGDTVTVFNMKSVIDGAENSVNAEAIITERNYNENTKKYNYVAQIDNDTENLIVENGEEFDISITVGTGVNNNLSDKNFNNEFDLVVPKSAITSSFNDSGTIYIIEEKESSRGNKYIAKMVEVKIIDYNDSKAAIRGINEKLQGKSVVVSASKNLNDGAEVRVLEE